MHGLLGLLSVLVVLVAPIDDVYPIEIKTEHGAVAWTAELADPATACRAKAWIGRIGEQPGRGGHTLAARRLNTVAMMAAIKPTATATRVMNSGVFRGGMTPVLLRRPPCPHRPASARHGAAMGTQPEGYYEMPAWSPLVDHAAMSRRVEHAQEDARWLSA